MTKEVEEKVLVGVIDAGQYHLLTAPFLGDMNILVSAEWLKEIKHKENNMQEEINDLVREYNA